MVALSDKDASRAMFHLCGTRAGVPAGDMFRIVEAIRTIPDDVAKSYVIAQLDRCDNAFNQIATAGDTQIVAAENYSGDINRTVQRAQKNLQIVKFYWERYYMEVDQLARTLWCPEFRTPDSDYYRYARNGGEYVNSVPGTQGVDGDAFTAALLYA